MTPTLLSQPAPLSPASPAIPRVDSALRLSLHPVLDRRAVVDGAWWPYSRDAAAELPGLIAAVDQRLGRTTLLVGVSRDAWQRIPRRIPARGRQVRIGGFRHADPHVVVLFFATAEPVALLVIPPSTAACSAEATLKLTAHDTAGLTADDILILTRLPPEPAAPVCAMAAGSLACWENEGGSVTDQEVCSSIARPSGPA
ncbi:DUF5994 family protein [Nonomuraea sp. NPDC049400]|uniref:DUF5994 family protein n=1 Tax=Nonomuraea sp. NPDC049400 TaxID=3364352 RepID=UPI00378D1E41